MRRGVMASVRTERYRQDDTWGEQNHPDGTGHPFDAYTARAARYACKQAARLGQVTWRDILWEEVAEAFAEREPALLRAELIQVAAVAVAWCEAIDRRSCRQCTGMGPHADLSCTCCPCTCSARCQHPRCGAAGVRP